MGVKVRSYLTEEIVTIHETNTVKDAIKQMLEEETECLVVIKPNGHVAGIITELDIIQLRKQADFLDLLVRDIYDQVFFPQLDPDDFMEDAADLLVRHHNVDQVVVAKRGTPQGVLTKRDVLRWLDETQSVS